MLSVEDRKPLDRRRQLFARGILTGHEVVRRLGAIARPHDLDAVLSGLPSEFIGPLRDHVKGYRPVRAVGDWCSPGLPAYRRPSGLEFPGPRRLARPDRAPADRRALVDSQRAGHTYARWRGCTPAAFVAASAPPRWAAVARRMARGSGPRACHSTSRSIPSHGPRTSSAGWAASVSGDLAACRCRATTRKASRITSSGSRGAGRLGRRSPDLAESRAVNGRPPPCRPGAGTGTAEARSHFGAGPRPFWNPVGVPAVRSRTRGGGRRAGPGGAG